MPLSSKKTIILIACIAIVAFVESFIPFAFSTKYAPDGYQFVGQVSYVPDQNMYFSFISQARDGAFAMKDKLTYLPHSAAFINLEYWTVGFIQRITGVNENTVYHIWRALGVIALSIGFWMMALLVLPTNRRRLAAFFAFICTGGFGFVFAALSKLGLVSMDTTYSGIIDMRYGMLPFQQIIANPHFSLPSGLTIIAYAYFLLGERHAKTHYYLLSGLFFCIVGLVRPYDIIPPFIIFPVYVLITARSNVFADMQALVRRMLPLLIVLPVLAYNLWLFKMHPVFKNWSSQGHNSSSLPSVWWHYMAYGIVGLLAIVRLLQIKKMPLQKKELFFVLWFGITFTLMHLGKYIDLIGWSPQIGVYLLAPLTLLAFSLNFRELIKKAILRRIAFGGILVCIVFSNLAITSYFSRTRANNLTLDLFYVSDYEMQAMKWLKDHASSEDIILANLVSSQRIAKYTKSGVVAAHYSVTPNFAFAYGQINTLLADSSIVFGDNKLPANLRISYVYLRSAGKMPQQNTKRSLGKYLHQVYSNKEVTICKVQ